MLAVPLLLNTLSFVFDFRGPLIIYQIIKLTTNGLTGRKSVGFAEFHREKVGHSRLWRTILHFFSFLFFSLSLFSCWFICFICFVVIFSVYNVLFSLKKKGEEEEEPLGRLRRARNGAAEAAAVG